MQIIVISIHYIKCARVISRSGNASLQPFKVAIFLRWELLVSAIFHNLSFVHDYNAITFHDSRESVCDHNWSPTNHGLIEGLLNDLLTLFIEGWGCLVQNQNLWVFYESPSNSYALFLTSRKFRSFQTTNLLKASMKALLISFDFFAIYKHFKAFFVEFFNSGSFLPDEVLELKVLFIFFLYFFDKIIYSLHVKLTLINL